MNPRYTLQLYIFWAVTVAYAIEILLKRLMNNTGKRFSVSLIGVAIVFVYIGLPLPQIQYNDYGIYNVQQLYVNEIAEIATISKRNNDGRALLDEETFNYYFDNKGLVIFTDLARDIRLAKTMQELECALDEQQIKYIVMHPYLDGVYWGEDTTLKKYVMSDYIKETIMMPNIALYIRK
jgi:hypothetical protein